MDISDKARTIDMSTLQQDFVAESFKVLKAENDKSEKLTALLREDMLDLNLLESQLMTTLSENGISADSVHKQLSKSAKLLGFKGNDEDTKPRRVKLD